MVNENAELSLVEFYSKLLGSTGLIVQPDGAVLVDDGGGPRPLTINNAALFLPTQEVLKSGNLTGKVIFHPVWENAVRKESLVFKRLSDTIRAKLHLTVISLLQGLTMIACDPGKHSLLSPEQSIFLSLMPDANAKTREALTGVLNQVSGGRNGKKLITFFMKRHGIYENREVRRLARVAFPLLDEKTTNEKSIFGVKMSQRYKDEILRLFEYILPNCDIADTYSFGSDELLAPNFTALMGAYYKLASQLNSVVEKFKTVLDEPYELLCNLDWYDSMCNIQKYRVTAPAFPGNEGETVDGQEDTGAAPGVVAGTGVIAPTATMQPQTQTAQAPVTANVPRIDKSKLFGNIEPVRQQGPLSAAVAANNLSKPDAPMMKWTDHANKLVSSGMARPGNAVEDAMLNNHGAQQVIVVDQNGNPVNVVNPLQLQQQAQMQQMQAQYWQMFVAQAPMLGINLSIMTQEAQQAAFQIWIKMQGGAQQTQQPMFNAPQNTFNAFGGVMNTGMGFGVQQNDPFALPGRQAAEQAKRMGGLIGGMGSFNGPSAFGGMRR